MAGKHSEGRREKQTKRIEEEEEIPKAFRKDGDNMQKTKSKTKSKMIKVDAAEDALVVDTKIIKGVYYMHSFFIMLLIFIYYIFRYIYYKIIIIMQR